MTYHTALEHCVESLGFDAVALRDDGATTAVDASRRQKLVEGVVDELLFALDYDDIYEAAVHHFSLGGETPHTPDPSSNWAPLALRCALMTDLHTRAKEAVSVTLEQCLTGERVVVCTAGPAGLKLLDIQNPHTHAYYTSHGPRAS